MSDQAEEFDTERGAARLAHLLGVQGVAGSNPAVPTTFLWRLTICPGLSTCFEATSVAEAISAAVKISSIGYENIIVDL